MGEEEEEEGEEPDDVLEGLADVHGQVPDEDHPPAHRAVNVPEPETENNCCNNNVDEAEEPKYKKNRNKDVQQ